MKARVETAPPLIAGQGVGKRFGGVQALRGVDFDLNQGEIHALLGENGAGKSTLMNIPSGGIEPDAGEVRIEGAPVRFADPRAAQEAASRRSSKRLEVPFLLPSQYQVIVLPQTTAYISGVIARSP